MSTQASGSSAAAPAQPAVVLPPNGPEAPPQVAQPNAAWGLSTLSSCCISLDDCTGNYLSAGVRRVVDFISYYWNELVALVIGSDDAESEDEIQGLEAAEQQLTPAQFLEKWEQIQQLAPEEHGFAEQQEELVRDIRGLPENLQIQLGTNALLQCLEHPERVIKLFTLMVKQSPANRDFLETIRSYRPPALVANAEAPKKPAEPYVMTREAFLKKWKKKKPPAPPKPNAKPNEKDKITSVEWVNDVWGVCKSLPDRIGFQITMLLQGGDLCAALLGDAQARANLTAPERLDRSLAARVADPIIIGIIENFRPEPQNLPPD